MDSDLDIKTIMDPWMYQMGLPVVNITDFNNGALYVSQSRFLNNPAANFSDPPSEYGLVFALIQLYSATALDPPRVIENRFSDFGNFLLISDTLRLIPANYQHCNTLHTWCQMNCRACSKTCL